MIKATAGAISLALLMLSIEWLSLLILGIWVAAIALWLIVEIGKHGY